MQYISSFVDNFSHLNLNSNFKFINLSFDCNLNLKIKNMSLVDKCFEFKKAEMNLKLKNEFKVTDFHLISMAEGVMVKPRFKFKTHQRVLCIVSL